MFQLIFFYILFSLFCKCLLQYNRHTSQDISVRQIFSITYIVIGAAVINENCLRQINNQTAFFWDCDSNNFKDMFYKILFFHRVFQEGVPRCQSQAYCQRPSSRKAVKTNKCTQIQCKSLFMYLIIPCLEVLLLVVSQKRIYTMQTNILLHRMFDILKAIHHPCLKCPLLLRRDKYQPHLPKSDLSSWKGTDRHCYQQTVKTKPKPRSSLRDLLPNTTKQTVLVLRWTPAASCCLLLFCFVPLLKLMDQSVHANSYEGWLASTYLNNGRVKTCYSMFWNVSESLCKKYILLTCTTIKSHF